MMFLQTKCLFVGLLAAVLPAAQQPEPMPVIDGLLDDKFWAGVPAEELVPAGKGIPRDAGSTVRTVIVGRYLLVAARLAEPGGRVVARVTGRNPTYEDEDLLRIVAGPDIGYTDREVKINPFGAYSVARSGQFVHPNADKYLVATRVAAKEWTVEFSLPLNEVSAPGSEPFLVQIERIRAERPGQPQQRWRWPALGPVAKITARQTAWDSAAPEFRPQFIGNGDPPLEVGRVEKLPPLDAAWNDAPWKSVPAWGLLRDTPLRIAPRFPTEVKAVHDGGTLAILARCIEPGEVLANKPDSGARPRPEDSFRVYLATSGSAYAQFLINPAGIRQEGAGMAGGPRISRPREWESGSRSAVQRTADAWTVRLDIPLEPVAQILGEMRVPEAWRVLFSRVRPARSGDPEEISILPVVESQTAIAPARYRRLALLDSGSPAAPREQSNAPAHSLAAVDFRVLSPAQRAEMRAAEMVQRHIRARVDRIAEEENRAWGKIASRSDWERFLEPRLKALAASMGKFPERQPLKTVVAKEFPGEGYRRQDLAYQSRPGLWVTANLYLPARVQPGMPGIVIVHSHHRPRTQAELQDMGILWARAGCAVLIMDQIGHGERLQHYPWNRDSYHGRYLTGMQLYTAGESLLKWMVWDIMRGIDLLLERDDVDPERIILLGAVAAGGEPAAVTAALDRRVAAVAPFNFGRTPPGWGEWESTRCLRRSIVDRFFPWVIAASVAPRRLIYSNEMGWESYRNHETWERFQKIFGFYGARDRLDEAHGFGTFPGPGECSNIGPAQRKTLYPELEKWFGIPPPEKEPEDRRPEAELATLTPELAARLGMRPIHDLAREVAVVKLDSARAGLGKLDSASRSARLQAALAAILGDVEPNRRPERVQHWTKRLPNAEAEGFTLEVEPGITLPAVLLRPLNRRDERLPVVIAVAQDGKDQLLAHRSQEIEPLLKNGIAVCLPDVRGTGETSPDAGRGPGSEEVGLASTEFMLGGTLLGARVKDLRTVIAYLRTNSLVDARRIGLWGDSLAPLNPERLLLDEVPGWQVGPEIQHQAEPLGGLLAILGALYEPDVRAVAAVRGLVAYLSLLDDPFAYLPNDVIVPGILEVADIADIAAAIAPRPLLLSSLVDARNRPASEGMLRTQLGPVYDAWRSNPGNLLIRSQDPGQSTAEWLRVQLAK